MKPTKSWLIVALGLLVAGLAIYLALPSEEPEEARRDREVAEEPGPPEPPEPQPAREPRVPENAAQQKTSAAPEPSPAPTDTAFVVGPHPDDPHPPGALPHPITPEHERLRYENQLIQGLNDAIDLRNVERIRELVELYRTAEPEDVHKLQEGYTIIADCIEFPGPESRARAQHYWNTERASILRRYVRRHCGL